MVTCIDASDTGGTGTGLLTEGKKYGVYGEYGGYYIIICDDGKSRTKSKSRFKYIKEGTNE